MKKVLSLFLSIVMLVTMVGSITYVTEAAEAWLWPVPSSRQINQYYSGNHDGLDIGGASNCSVVATMSGTVVYSHYGDISGAYYGGGNFVVIKHSNGYYSHYAHLNSRSVSQGQNVSQGQEIGKMGSTGNSTGTHLHFAIATSMYGAGGRINNNPGSINYVYSLTPANLTFNINSTTNISTNSATVNFSISNPSNQTVSKVGIKIKKSSEANWSKIYEEIIPSSIYNSSTLNTTYVIGSGKEINYALSSGTEYTWIAYAVTGQGTYTSGNNKFTTKSKCAYYGHTSGSNSVSKATTSNDGRIVKRCSVCGQILSTTVIPKISSIKLSSSAYAYDGKVKTPSVIVKDSRGKTLVKNTDYTVSYAKGRKYVGKYAVKITFKGKYSGAKTLYFYVRPKTTSVSSVSAGSKKFTVKWKKQATQTTGYQIQYSTSSKFTNYKTAMVTKNSTTSKTISKLSAKKKYYVRVRTYKTVKINGKATNIYSGWSKAKYVTTK